ncbi:Dam family site-specific DNA-(adenine-N6)-methyltransferase [Xanthomonas perforans]|uniref:Site-specific DNA-methyltransferase (adenine-specific) n=2 Tax=Xanthomonas perforans TaxID=442694 RepID=A0A0G8U8I0_XANPE|nr:MULTISPECIES: Dam family site-specific DNA-(adenine-N6)-methyltransferase [Xanthomonas]APO99616.1 DNA methyltransferase [Xanthomonas perforans]AQS76097.1 DNA methyltransferase [Xanthomonas perforans 91-118]KLC05552.1 DNA methyltransferase [Xanthomonas perforans]KLC61607.1 DNA methyltransferase [Xanthomonas perforans]MBZ2418145.1 Dam family site-specific DNA-(adenine-N6)-methyltransferase [Xanthomonas perforans]
MYRPLPLRTLDHVNFKSQLLKWVGNKQRVASELISYFPPTFNTYIEPFVGSGAVLGTLAPKSAIAGDIFAPLLEIWKALKDDPELVIAWYQQRHNLIGEIGKVEAYKSVLSSYNRTANGADLLFLSRTCYGGVIRFRKSDGFMSTPCGPHAPMPPDNFAARAYIWHRRVKGTQFHHADYRDLMERAKPGDLIYCDPPYVDSQSILYGAQDFRLSELFHAIAACKKRGVYVALSIDGTKKSGNNVVRIDPPTGLFKREVLVNCGRSMLRRFQMDGQTLESELVADRLLLTY